jgi:hypothetical protein
MHQYDVTVKNTSAQVVKNAAFNINGATLTQVWNVQGALNQSHFTVPTWLSGGVVPNSQFTFGFIADGPCQVSVSYT